MNSSFGFTIFSIVIAAFASSGILSLLLPLLRRRLLDHPNSRSSHCKPTPSGGGLAFVLVVAVTSAIDLFRILVFQIDAVDYQLSILPVLSLPLAIVGFLDDRLNLPAGLRYGSQLLTAIFLAISSHLTISLLEAFSVTALASSLFLILFFVIVLITITGVINFVNFMDGLDGLVAGCLAVAISALAFQLQAPSPIWALVGALLGFLFWNWSPAKVFMGDVGSTFLGAVFAGLVLQASSWSEALGYLLVATPLLGDACFCVLRRCVAGQSVFEAHRLHLYQRLNQAGWSHARVSFVYIAATMLLAFAMLMRGGLWVSWLAIAELLVGMWLDRRFAVPFAAASKT